MFRITKDFAFSASHVLHGLPEGHQCARMHGHNFIVRLVLEGDELDATGFVRDYGTLAPFKEWLNSTLDHRHLNDIMQGIQPSAENLARFIFEQFADQFPELAEVSVSETPLTWASYRPPEEPL